MSTVGHPVSVRRGLLTPGAAVLAVLAVTGLGAAAYRFLFGLGAASNLSDQYPWGIWIGIDVASGVALAAGGFTSAAVAHIFHRHKYEALVRPALLTAMLGYTFAVLGLFADLGRFYNIWHPMIPIMWQGNSVLFEVAMCVMVYLNVLYIEFLPILCERFAGRVNLPGPLRSMNGLAETAMRLAQATLGKVMFVFIVGGVVLSCMHQSSLGALLLIAPYKVNPLWYTPIMPLLFLLSAFTAGFAMVIFESLLSAWTFKLTPETKILSAYSRFLMLFLGVYCLAKASDFLVREAYHALLISRVASVFFLVEIVFGILVPLILLSSTRVRRSVSGLFTASALVVAGVLLNRVNVFLVAFRPPYAESPYFPSLAEILITTGLISALVLTYRVFVTIFPILPAEEGAPARELEKEPAPAQTEPYAA